MDGLIGIAVSPQLLHIWGLSGTAVIVLGCLVTAVVYRGKENERYNPFNHFISELGEVNVSKLAHIFNGSLVIGGILFCLFMIQFGRFIGTLPAYASLAAGIFTALSCSMVGLLPVNNLPKHIIAATCFFYGGVITIIVSAIAVVTYPQRRMPSAFIIYAIIVILVFISFLAALKLSGRKGLTLNPMKLKRPTLWLLPSLEFVVILGIIGWIAALSLSFL